MGEPGTMNSVGVRNCQINFTVIGRIKSGDYNSPEFRIGLMLGSLRIHKYFFVERKDIETIDSIISLCGANDWGAIDGLRIRCYLNKDGEFQAIGHWEENSWMNMDGDVGKLADVVKLKTKKA
jgi:hypothetical protein